MSKEEREALITHIDECQRCTEELQLANRIMLGIEENQEMIRDGHIDSRLLYEYSSEQKKLGAHTITMIQDHLDDCRECTRALEEIVDMQKFEPESMQKVTLTEKIRGFFEAFTLRPVFVVSALLLIVVGIYFGVTDGKFVVELVENDNVSRQMAHKVLILEPTPRNGRKQNQSGYRGFEYLDLSSFSEGEVLLNLHGEHFQDEPSPQRIIIIDRNEKVCWSSETIVPEEAPFSIKLILDIDTFDKGIYEIRLVDTDNHTQSKTFFRVN